jgi:hypothetical protein
MRGGVEIHRAESDFWVDNIRFSKDDFVILLSQPFRAYVKDLMEAQRYPDLRSMPDGPPIRPYDVCGWTLPLMMGVTAKRIERPFSAELTAIKSVRQPEANFQRDEGGHYFISHNTNRSFIAVNRLLKEKKKVHWLKEQIKMGDAILHPGTFYIPRKEIDADKMELLAQSLALNIRQVSVDLLGTGVYRIKPNKLGLYQPWTANIDEGWTRLILEEFEFPFDVVHNVEVRSGKLKGDFHAVIIPDMDTKQIIDGRKPEKTAGYLPKMPPGYDGGITDNGVEAFRQFVLDGGTLITLNRACNFAIEKFGLPVENVVKDKSDKEFLCPGSLLKLAVHNAEPLAYGMPASASAMFAYGPVFRPIPWAQQTRVVASYVEQNPLASGWIAGQHYLQGMPAILEIPFGEGRVVLLGFKVQNRGQTHGTFKFLFNAIHSSRIEEMTVEK